MVQTQSTSSTFGVNMEDGGHSNLLQIMKRQQEEFDKFAVLKKVEDEKLDKMFADVNSFLANFNVADVRQSCGQPAAGAEAEAGARADETVKYKCSHGVEFEFLLQDGILDCPRCKKTLKTRHNLNKHLQADLKSCKCSCSP